MIEGVQIKKLITHTDEGGSFTEIIRSDDKFFDEGFGQWSHSIKHQGVIKAWHIHRYQVDWWYVPFGAMKAVVWDAEQIGGAHQEFLMGPEYENIVLKISPGIAHGFEVLQGPCHLLYITSKVYNPEDEGRISYLEGNYDWLKTKKIN